MARHRPRGSVRSAWKFFLLSCVLILVKLQWDVGDSAVPLLVDEKEQVSPSTRSSDSLSAPRVGSAWKEKPRDDTPSLLHSLQNHTSGTSGTLILFVQSWREGMAGWRKSLANLQVYAKRLHAKVVEPGISNGRLVAGKGNLRLLELMDPTKFDPDVDWISLEELQQALLESNSTAVTTIHMCLDICDPSLFEKKRCKPRKGPLACPLGNNQSIPSDYRKKSSPRLKQALDLVAEGKVVLLKIHEFWKDGLSQIRLIQESHNQSDDNKGPSIVELHDGKEADRLRNLFDFQPRLYKLAIVALELLGIPQGHPFHAIHWRAELASMNYAECARRILTAQQQMILSSASSNETKFILLSSLSTDRTRIWRGKEIYAEDSQTALHMLLKHNGPRAFLKVDQVYDALQLRDPIEAAAIDLILAEKASHFATCTSKCSKNCLQCNHSGFFALLAIGMRNKQLKQSYPCWPGGKLPTPATDTISVETTPIQQPSS